MGHLALNKRTSLRHASSQSVMLCAGIFCHVYDPCHGVVGPHGDPRTPDHGQDLAGYTCPELYPKSKVQEYIRIGVVTFAHAPYIR